MSRSRPILLCMLAISSALTLLIGPRVPALLGDLQGDPTYSDDFDDNTRDIRNWNSFSVGFGPTVSETDQQLEVSFPAISSDDPVLGVFGAGYTSICELRGDFDLQVDFQLITWPFGNGVRLGVGGPEATFLTRTTINSAVERVSFGDFSADSPGQFREVYLTHFGDGVQGFIPTDDLSGKLRLVRSGSILTGYFFSNGWVSIHSGPSTGSDFHVSLVAWSHDYAFIDYPVKIALDNFIVSQGRLICPQGISVSEFFTDTNLNPLVIDDSGNPKVDIILARGQVRSTAPGQGVAWVNMTNLGPEPLHSVVMNETLPLDWLIYPKWLPPIGAIHVFFDFINGTRLEITDLTSIAVSTSNPQRVSLSVEDLTSTTAAKTLEPGERILLSVKLTYGLTQSSQSANSYPRNYAATAMATAWSEASFTGNSSTGTASAFFIAFARVLGDIDGNSRVDIFDIASLAYSYSSRPGDDKWNTEADQDENGVIDVLDLAIVAFYFGTIS